MFNDPLKAESFFDQLLSECKLSLRLMKVGYFGKGHRACMTNLVLYL